MSDFYSKLNLFKEITYNKENILNIFSKYKILSSSPNISNYTEYIVLEGDRWDSLSFKFYNTVNLWWVIAIFNNIKDPFQELEPGSILKIIHSNYLKNILSSLKREKEEIK